MQFRGLLPEDSYANCANGYRIHYLDQGEGEAVVFLHGSGPGASGYSNFKGNYPFLVAAGYRCIIPDLIGYGFSDKPDNVDHPLSFFVECVKQTLDEAGVERCTVVGNSLGGAVALGLALDYPERVSKLVLMAPGGLNELPEYQAMPGMQKVFQVFGSQTPVTTAVMQDLFATALMHNPAYATDTLVAERMQIMEIMNGHVMATMTVPNLTTRLPDIQCPTLSFWGLNEQMMPEDGIQTLSQGIPAHRMILVNQCGHWVMVEHEALFNRMTLDFLQHG